MFTTPSETQLTPPLVVLRKVFRLPIINPFNADGNFTSKRVCVVPEVCGLQVVPPFEVNSIFPFAPTTHPVFELIKYDEKRFSVVPDVCACQSAFTAVVKKMNNCKTKNNFSFIAALRIRFQANYAKVYELSIT